MRGLIIVGYQGVGKSSCAGKENCIDLESSNFKLDDGSRTPDWHKTYCMIAIDLAEQGYNVFVSSHEEVHEYLRNYYDRVVVFCPQKSMKREWIYRLTDRYLADGSPKNKRALFNAIDRYNENITELVSCGLPVYQPSAMDYDLMDYVHKIRNDFDKKDGAFFQ